MLSMLSAIKGGGMDCTSLASSRQAGNDDMARSSRERNWLAWVSIRAAVAPEAGWHMQAGWHVQALGHPACTDQS